jgi:hypothetical protein
MTEHIILKKDGIIFKTKAKNHYFLDFFIENPCIDLPSIINFDFIKYVYQINADLYEKIDLNKINENEAVIILVIKHFLEDLGIPQQYAHLIVTRQDKNNQIIFNAKTIDIKPDSIKEDLELLQLECFILDCEIIHKHKIYLKYDIIFKPEKEIPSFVEKMIGMVISKMILRTKQFIENIHVK